MRVQGLGQDESRDQMGVEGDGVRWRTRGCGTR